MNFSKENTYYCDQNDAKNKMNIEKIIAKDEIPSKKRKIEKFLEDDAKKEERVDALGNKVIGEKVFVDGVQVQEKLFQDPKSNESSSIEKVAEEIAKKENHWNESVASKDIKSSVDSVAVCPEDSSFLNKNDRLSVKRKSHGREQKILLGKSKDSNENISEDVSMTCLNVIADESKNGDTFKTIPKNNSVKVNPENIEESSLCSLKTAPSDIPLTSNTETSLEVPELEVGKDFAIHREKKGKFQQSLGAVKQDKATRSPNKRLELKAPVEKEIFIYGNYKLYYGNRNKDQPDGRLFIFKDYPHIFNNKTILDIGCNAGFVTMEIAKNYNIQHIYGLDIDQGLIKKAIKCISNLRKGYPFENSLRHENKFPFNITFKYGNYVLKDDCLLEIETPKFDVVLCLSVTKWIHLNFGDQALKQAFRRMYLQLNPGGKLILEAQPYKTYRRRKNLSAEILKNFKAIKFFPSDFDKFLLSPEVGFNKVEVMGVPDHSSEGFRRPIKLFYKD